MSGPVTRNLVRRDSMVTVAYIDEIINKALADNLFHFATWGVFPPGRRDVSYPTSASV